MDYKLNITDKYADFAGNPIRIKKISLPILLNKGAAVSYKIDEEDREYIYINEYWADEEAEEDCENYRDHPPFEQLETSTELIQQYADIPDDNGNYVYVYPVNAEFVTEKYPLALSEEDLKKIQKKIKATYYVYKLLYQVSENDFLIYCSRCNNGNIIIYGYGIKKEYSEDIFDGKYSEELKIEAFTYAAITHFFDCTEKDDGFGEEKYRRPEYVEKIKKEKNALKESNPEVKELLGTRLYSELKAWLANTTFLDFKKDIFEELVGQPAAEDVLVYVYRYLNQLLRGRPEGSNIIIAAPTGCGKTETYRVLKKYFKEHIPELYVAIFDVSTVTEAGFKGVSINELYTEVMKQGPVSAKTMGIGIIFMDEFDKKITPSYSSYGQNVNMSVLNQMLTLIEGNIVYDGKGSGINSANSMFVGLGSFDELRENEGKEKTLGFMKSSVAREKFEHITRNDILKAGANSELVGRFADIINYDRLNVEGVNRIIDNLLKKSCQGTEFKPCITDVAREYIYQQTIKSRFGCREIKNILSKVMHDGYKELLNAGTYRAKNIIIEIDCINNEITENIKYEESRSFAGPVKIAVVN